MALFLSSYKPFRFYSLPKPKPLYLQYFVNHIHERHNKSFAALCLSFNRNSGMFPVLASKQHGGFLDWNYLFPLNSHETNFSRIKKIISLGLRLMFLCFLFNYSIFRDPKNALALTAEGKSVEFVPFLKTWVSVPAAAFGLSYALTLAYPGIIPIIAFSGPVQAVLYRIANYYIPPQASAPDKPSNLPFWGYPNQIPIAEAKRFFLMIGRDVNVPISFFNRTVNNYPVLDKTLGPRVGIRRIALCGAVVVLVLGFVFCVWWKNASQQNEPPRKKRDSAVRTDGRKNKGLQKSPRKKKIRYGIKDMTKPQQWNRFYVRFIEIGWSWGGSSSEIM